MLCPGGGRLNTDSALSLAQRSSSATGTSRSLPRRMSRSSGWTWRSNESSDMPSETAASWRLSATRGTFLGLALMANLRLR